MRLFVLTALYHNSDRLSLSDFLALIIQSGLYSTVVEKSMAVIPPECFRDRESFRILIPALSVSVRNRKERFSTRVFAESRTDWTLHKDGGQASQNEKITDLKQLFKIFLRLIA
jgi:hypothetical protein